MTQAFAVANLEEMSVQEMRETTGGILPVLAIGALLVLSGCTTTGGDKAVGSATSGSPPPPQQDTTSN